jgi:hypothetical protein
MACRESTSHIQTGLTASSHSSPLAWGLTRFNPSNRMKILSINTHLTYPGWSEGKLNLAFMDLAKAFFVERGHQVAETFVERGYDPEEEVKKHAAADLVILQTPVNWFSAPWIYKKYVDEVSMWAWPRMSCSRAMAAHASMVRAAKCRERSS